MLIKFIILKEDDEINLHYNKSKMGLEGRTRVNIVDIIIGRFLLIK
jgi:hypothetical protein